jgi:MarR family transcriptional regulator, lower aerobic nicotinate degradation pathway regulator
MMGDMAQSQRDRESALPESLLQSPSFILAQLVREARRIGTRVNDDDLRMPHIMVLASLEWFGPAAQRDISGRLRIDASDLVSVLDDLEERGLVERKRDERDRRRYVVSITTAGASVQHSWMVSTQKLNDILLAPLDQEERERLHEMLVRVYRHHDPHKVSADFLSRIQAISKAKLL